MGVQDIETDHVSLRDANLEKRRGFRLIVVLIILVMITGSTIYYMTRPNEPEVVCWGNLQLLMNEPQELKFKIAVIWIDTLWNDISIHLFSTDSDDSDQEYVWRLGSFFISWIKVLNQPAMALFDSGGITCTIYDISWNSYVNAGDYFTLTPEDFLENGYTYELTLFYEPTSEELGGVRFLWSC